MSVTLQSGLSAPIDVAGVTGEAIATQPRRPSADVAPPHPPVPLPLDCTPEQYAAATPEQQRDHDWLVRALERLRSRKPQAGTLQQEYQRDFDEDRQGDYR